MQGGILNKVLQYLLWAGLTVSLLGFTAAFVSNTIVIQRDMLTKRDLIVASKAVLDTLLAGCKKERIPDG